MLSITATIGLGYGIASWAIGLIPGIGLIAVRITVRLTIGVGIILAAKNKDKILNEQDDIGGKSLQKG